MVLLVTVMPPRDAIATPRGHRCEATCSACVFPDRGQGLPIGCRVILPSSSHLVPRSATPDEAKAAFRKWSNNQQKIDASQPTDRFTLAAQCRALSRAKDLRWSARSDG